MAKYYMNTIFAFFFVFACCAHSQPKKQTYVVYMGASSSDSKAFLTNSHLSMLSSAIGSYKLARSSLIYTYTHAINGFSAVLSEEEAKSISDMAGVVSVFPSKMHKLHTTRTWEFLETLEAKYVGGILESKHKPNPEEATDVIIGMLDTGVWPEAENFRDDGMGAIPSRWKGTCMKGTDFNSTNCNKKLIGARYYGEGSAFSVEHEDNYAIYKGPSEELRQGMVKESKRIRPTESARDTIGHGSHTASTAGGRKVANASYYGLAKGVASGGAPLSRVAVYKVCSEGGCSDADILAAFDDSIKDGVDILSLSLGASGFFTRDIVTDGIAIGAFHAVQNGVLVVCSAGNDGPSHYTVVNTAPWILTVAASTLDRSFNSKAILGNNATYEGAAMNYFDLEGQYDLVFGGDIAAPEVSNTTAGRCTSDSLDATKAKGKILLCFQSNADESRTSKSMAVKDAGGVGMIIGDDLDKYAPSLYEIPSTQISSSAATEILNYIRTDKKPTATILKAETQVGFKPAPVLAKFSSRGPSKLTENILKPDIMAPGVNIIAAWTQASPYSDPPEGQNGSAYSIISGTSMSCPHVTGAAASLKSSKPTWSVSALKSALMTTANRLNNKKVPITNDTDGEVTWMEMGSGELDPTGAVDPGLVYETAMLDNYLFLCHLGLNDTQIASISSNKTFTCPAGSNSTTLISNINYPSIAVSELASTTTVKRTLTNVGPSVSTYKATIVAPPGVNVTVTPNVLAFTAATKAISVLIKMTVTAAPSPSAVRNYVYGSVTFSDGTRSVFTPLAVNPVSM